jgi:hypothetical protein
MLRSYARGFAKLGDENVPSSWDRYDFLSDDAAWTQRRCGARAASGRGGRRLAERQEP